MTIKTRGWLYSLLVLLFLVIHIAGTSEVAPHLNHHVSDWATRLAPYSELLLAGLLAYLVLHSEAEREHSEEERRLLGQARATLSEDIKNLENLRSDIVAIKTSVEALRQQFRSADVALHGKMLFYERKYDEAAEVFKEVVRADAGPLNHYWLGLSLLRSNDASSAIRHLNIAVEQIGDAESYRARGEAYFRARNPQLAEGDLLRAIDLGIPNRAQTQYLLARVQRPLDSAKAKQTLQDLVARNPYDSVAIRELVSILLEEGSHEDALEICENCLRVNPNNWTVYPCRAEVLFARDGPGDEARATADLEIAKRRNKKDRNIYRIGGQYWAKKASSDLDPVRREQAISKAVEYYEEGAKAPPKSTAILAALVGTYLMRGSFSEALEVAKRAVNTNPELLTNHLALCAALFANGRWLPLITAARDARECNSAGRPGRILGLTLELLAGLYAGETLTEQHSKILELIEALRAMPDFRREWTDWPYIRDKRHKANLNTRERKFEESLINFMDGHTSAREVIESLRTELDEGGGVISGS
jgi:tetratricopeptide (TPR) repeat protein